jgi:F-type H+-transporting ATPase subunit c
MKRNSIATVVAAMFPLLLVANSAFAQDGAVDPNGYKGTIALAAGLGIGIAVLGGALGQGMAARAALEGTARNPQASGKVLVPMILGLALIESLVIVAFVVTYGLAGKA